MLKARVLDPSSMRGSQGTKTPSVGAPGLFFPVKGMTTSVRSELSLSYSRAEAAADARRQRVKLYSEYCEPFATKQMRPDRLARRVKTPFLVLVA
jgi:hypothetical protein